MALIPYIAWCAGQTFGSATAFSIHCKRQQTPNKHADDGWKSVMYAGKPLQPPRLSLSCSSHIEPHAHDMLWKIDMCSWPPPAGRPLEHYRRMFWQGTDAAAGGASAPLRGSPARSEVNVLPLYPEHCWNASSSSCAQCEVASRHPAALSRVPPRLIVRQLSFLLFKEHEPRRSNVRSGGREEASATNSACEACAGR